MQNEINHAEIAENLEEMSQWEISHTKIKALQQAAADERRIANGELVEVVHAEWVKHDDESYTCMNCHRRMSKSAYGWPRCPSCGALMDGKDDPNA